MKKKILILADPLDNQNAGIHFYLKEFLHELDKYDFKNTEITIIRLSDKDEFQFINTKSLPMKNNSSLLKAIRIFYQIPKYAIENKFDYVFEPAHFGPFNLPPRIKRINFIHDLTPILFPKNHTFQGWFFQKLFLKSILKRSAYIFANSKNTRQDIINVYPFTREKVFSNYLGTSSRFENYIPHSNTSDKDNPFFLVVGSMEPRKGILTILDAFKNFKDGNKNKVQLYLAGPIGWKNSEIKQTLNNHKYLKEIKYLGYVNDLVLSSLYKRAISLIYASEYEGFGLPIVEAALHNTISIVAHNSSLIEVGQICNSIFFKTNDPVDLCQKLESVLKFEKRNIDTVAINNMFSWKNHCKKFVNKLNIN